MNYSFDIVGVSPTLQFFNYQQKVEQTPRRSKAYLGSYCCTLDAFIEATDIVHQKPDWNWDEVVNSMVDFWLNQEESIRHWKSELQNSGGDSLLIARVANLKSLRSEFEHLFDPGV
ncbi:hypothetical protein [Pseudanabaena sp. FACHB-2040]|uniref:hypothetical protein n=1 Tax=Pseudanabaena sp. FACHB-2040 TaxID=2692859 RepID=UPI00168634A3|nr:hypothetical protein [Pseudanabaena sp. FACHB-2040]MBD2256383.1 hypothetical protein [Pseudanabaena sp. FACHB-2040]